MTPIRLLCVTLTSCLAAAIAVAQCDPRWVPVQGVAGAFGYGSPPSDSMLWDPDGPGPAGTQLVVVGNFACVGSSIAQGIARWDLEADQWLPLGDTSALNGWVRCVAALPNGDLVIGGNFTFNTPTGATTGLARWNGSAWTPFGQPFTGTQVLRMIVGSQGQLVVGGSYTAIGGIAANSVAQWDGTTWRPFGVGLTGGTASVTNLGFLPDGSLLVIGGFQNTGATSCRNVARWNGTGWAQVGPSLGSGIFSGLHIDSDGTFFVGFNFTATGPGFNLNRVACWNGTTWQELSGGVQPQFVGGQASVREITRLPTGELLVGGRFHSAGPTVASSIATWNGTGWSAMGSGVGQTSSTFEPVWTSTNLPDGRLFVAGDLRDAGLKSARQMAVWSGNSWSPVAKGVDDEVLALSPAAGGGYIVGGRFTRIGYIEAKGVAHWDGRNWRPLGNGLPSYVTCVLGLSNGYVFAGGVFTVQGSTQVSRAALWDGVRWTSLGGPQSVSSSVLAAVEDAAGRLYVGGAFSEFSGVQASRVVRWTGVAWEPLGAGVNGSVNDMALAPNGDLIVVGTFSTAGGMPASGVARWSDGQWSPIGSGVTSSGSYVNSVAVLSNGDIIIGGRFEALGSTPARNVARWDGAQWGALGAGLWSNLSTGDVDSVRVDASDQIICGGRFNQPFTGIARWNGQDWVPESPPVTGPNWVRKLAVTNSGELICSGDFYGFGPVTSVFVGRRTAEGAPWVAEHPKSQSARPGATLNLAAGLAHGYENTAPTTYQWYHDTAPIPGAAGALSANELALLSLPDFQPEQAGAYHVVFTSTCGTSESRAADILALPPCATSDYDGDGDAGTDSDIEAFFVCLAGACCPTCWHLGADFDADGDTGTDADIEAFFRVLAGGPC